MNILLVATVSYAGMGPYASTIINTIGADNVYCLLVDNEKDYYKKNISLEIQKRSSLLKIKTSNINKLRYLVRPSAALIKEFNRICTEKQIDLVHFLTNDVTLCNSVLKRPHKYKVVFTVHDVVAHEEKKAIHKRLKSKVLFFLQNKVLEKNSNLITNSNLQFNTLQQKYPSKEIFFHEFPSLINQTIIEGNIIPTELVGVKNYILFFGRIEKYKGVDILYNAYVSNPSLKEKYPLVIAGAGDMYFDIDNSENVYLLNRYILDEEIAYLYKNAFCVVYPYISATQSGVFSVSCYFQTPTICSDILYFKQYVECGIAKSFIISDIKELGKAVLLFGEEDIKEMKSKQSICYSKKWNNVSLNQTLLDIYKSILQ